jgi:radical SAM protein with 4Fe4S-binding SPASM domain
MSEPQEYVLFINLTKKCNVDCQRCYLTEESRLNPLGLPIDLFIDFLKSDFFDDKKLVVIFQGGELSLLGKEKLIAYSEAVLNIRPNAKMAAVSNFLSLPNWLIDIAHKYWGSALETTFALDKKYTLDGSKEKYLDKFEASLKKANRSGLMSVVNIESNRETLECGADAFYDLVVKTGHLLWEFDTSIEFDSFMKLPLYNEYGYPVLKSSSSYAKLSEYLIEIDTKYGDKLKAMGVQSTIFMRKLEDAIDNQSFNVQKEHCFITLNPDGTVTSNPLFSDLKALFMGNIKHHSLSDLMGNKALLKRIEYEKKRILPCYSCQYFSLCKGATSLAPLFDGSGECAGLKKLWRHFQ